MSIYKLAEGDTRRFYNWGSKYRSKDNDSNAKEIQDSDEICLFTDPRDNQYNYEGYNFLVPCSEAKTRWDAFKNKDGENKVGNYKGPKGLEVCKCGWKE